MLYVQLRGSDSEDEADMEDEDDEDNPMSKVVVPSQKEVCVLYLFGTD